MGRVLGVDLGARRIGLALSDPTRLDRVAAPGGRALRVTRPPTAQRSSPRPGPRRRGRIVVGLPKALSGERGPRRARRAAEVEALRARWRRTSRFELVRRAAHHRDRAAVA